MSHTDLSPSSFSIASHCPASVTKARGKISLSGPAAKRGTALHSAVQRMLEGHPIPEFVEVEGEIYFLNEEDIAAVELVWELGEMLFLTNTKCSLEQKLDIDWYYAPLPPPEPYKGTSDFVAWDKDRQQLTIADWKFGRHPVAPDSAQNLSYAAMALAKYPTAKTVRLVIVQPQDEENPIKSVVMKIEDLMRWVHDVMDPTLKSVGANDQTENPGDHCKWCRRAGECQALHDRSLAEARIKFSDEEVPAPEDFSSTDLGKILDKAEMIESWIRSVRAEVSRRIDNGEKVQGWKLVEKRAIRKWTKLDEVHLILGHDNFAGLMHDDLFTQPEFKSPAQIEKAFKKHGLDFSKLNPYVARESSGSTLVRSSDPRPEVSIASRGAELFLEDNED